MPRHASQFSWLLLAWTLAWSGCAYVPARKPNAFDQHQASQQRVLARFERQRDHAQYQAALNRWREGDAAQCEELLTLLLHRNPGHRESVLLLAELHGLDGAPELAIDMAAAAAEAAPDDAELQELAGRLCLAVDHADDADRFFARAEEVTGLPARRIPYCPVMGEDLDTVVLASSAIAVHPDFETGDQPLVPETGQTHVEGQQGDPSSHLVDDLSAESAEPLCGEQPRELEPPTPATVLTWSHAEADIEVPAGDVQTPPASSGPRQASAVVGLVAAPSAHDGQPSAIRLIGEARRAFDSDEPARAQARLEAALSVAPDDIQVLVQACVVAIRASQPAIAVELLVPRLSRWPDQPVLQRTLGLAHWQRGDYAAAQVSLQQSLSLDNRSALTYFLLGSSLKRLGQTASAERHLEMAARLDRRFTQR